MKIPAPRPRYALVLVCFACFLVGETACRSSFFDSSPPSQATPAFRREFRRLPATARPGDRPAQIFASTGLSDSSIALAATRARREFDRIRSALDLPPLSPKNPAPPFTIALYADLVEYRRLARSEPGILPATLSRYDSRSRTLHVPARAPATTWRHEWTHALLADRRPGTPYWLHEGLALLLEETQSIDGRPRLPGRIQALRAKVIRHVEQDGGLRALLDERSPGPLAAPTAGWFCAYLDERRLLPDLIRSKADAPPPFAIPSRPAPGSPGSRDDFLRWLRTAGPQHATD